MILFFHLIHFIGDSLSQIGWQIVLLFRRELIFAFSGGLPVYIVGIVLAALSIWSFFMVGITDPGVVPKSKAF